MNPGPDIAAYRARILVVDDESDNREVLDLILTLEGFVVLTAASGEEAFASVTEQRRDLKLEQLADRLIFLDESGINTWASGRSASRPRSPWQNGYAERWVGTLRRELLDHVIVLGERHLLRLVRQHVAYYNTDRPHMSLSGDSPVTRDVEPPTAGKVIALRRVGGLHHRYSRAA
jgi:hypothetical protein